MVLNFYDYCYFAPARIPPSSLYQLPPESCLGSVTHPHDVQRKEAVRPRAVLVAAPSPSPHKLTAKRFPQLSLPQHLQQSLFFRPKNTSAGKIIYRQKKHLRVDLVWHVKGGPSLPACLCEEQHPQRGTRWPKRMASANGASLVGRQVLWSL